MIDKLRHRRTISQRRAKFLLRQWYYFDNNAAYLTEKEKEDMKLLYTALKELQADEREILATKYRVKERPYIKDSIVAQELGLSEHQYGDRRRRAEVRIQQSLDEMTVQEKTIRLDDLDLKTRVVIREVSIRKNITEEQAAIEILSSYADKYNSNLAKGE